MNPIAIFRHFFTEGPGYFAKFLDENDIPWHLYCIDQGDEIPRDVSQFSGLCFMGGPMSVNDPLPWIPKLLQLIKDAVDSDIPVIGHCLGGQLMAKALGAKVKKNEVKEIGWHPIQLIDSDIKRHWVSDVTMAQAFHWHGETFEIPSNATRIAESQYCANQMFALGKHLAMQCHVEMTEELIRSWCESGAQEIAESNDKSVQSTGFILESLESRITTLNNFAKAVYSVWIKGLKT